MLCILITALINYSKMQMFHYTFNSNFANSLHLTNSFVLLYTLFTTICAKAPHMEILLWKNYKLLWNISEKFWLALQNSEQCWFLDKTLKNTENPWKSQVLVETNFEDLCYLGQAFKLFQNLSGTIIILYGNIFFFL